MQKQIVAVALCLVMVSAFAITSVVSAQPDASAIRQFDVRASRNQVNDVVVGKLTIDTNSGHYIINVNWEKAIEQTKTYFKDHHQYKFSYWLYNTKPPYGQVDLGWIGLTNNGGNLHGEGTLSISQADLAKIAGWNPADCYATPGSVAPS
ncbi:MAG: hypothetical protein ACXV2B_08670 [Halobacteriota archaeon]